jgi:hypothetical protein
MRASIRARSSACAARLPFHREWLGPIASAAAEINALSGRNFCNLIVQQMRGSLAERFKCKVYDLTAKLFCAARGEPSWANDLNANDISPLETPKNERTLSNRWRRSLKAFTQDEIRRPQNGLNLFREVLQLWNRRGDGCDNLMNQLPIQTC